MLGALLFFDTVAFVPYLFAFVILGYALIKRRAQMKLLANKCNSYIIVFTFFLFLCTLNTLFHGANGLPNMYMQIATLMVAFSLRREDLKVFVVLTCIECIVGFYEYYTGIFSVLGVTDEAMNMEEDLLYFKRVLGLSGSSSGFSMKIMASIIFLYRIEPFSKKRAYFISVILFLGLYVTFNRTIIVATLVYLGITYFKKYKQEIRKKYTLGIFALLLVLVGFAYLWTNYGTSAWIQFSRGGDSESMLTGRPLIWASFGKFISDNFLFGNGSIHLLVPYYSGMIHAHNSFIQILADHGILLFTIYIINILIRIKKNMWPAVLPFFIASMAQYVLFWGFTINDVFFFAILFNPFIYTNECVNKSKTIVIPYTRY